MLLPGWSVCGKSTYRILVRGQSDRDCGRGQPDCSGEIAINKKSGWKIVKMVKCTVSKDNGNHGVTIPTYCNVDPKQGFISWRSGSTCGGCCACPDGAGVGIEVLVSNK